MQRVLDDVGQRPRDQRSIDVDGRQGGRDIRGEVDPAGKRASIRVDDLMQHRRGIDRRTLHRGRRGKARELRRDLPEQRDLMENRRHAFVERRGQRPSLVDVDALGVLG